MTSTSALLYLDTSLLISLVIPEARSRRLDDWMRAQSSPFCISWWTRAEFAGVLGRKVRARELTGREAVLVQERFDQTILPFLRDIPIDRATYTRCVALLGQHALGLRAPDALHLAVCRGLEPSTLVTADRKFYDAARRVGSAASLIS